MKFETWTFFVLGAFFIWNCVIMYRMDGLKDKIEKLRQDTSDLIEHHERYKHYAIDLQVTDLQRSVFRIEKQPIKNVVINHIVSWLLQHKKEVEY